MLVHQYYYNFQCKNVRIREVLTTHVTATVGHDDAPTHADSASVALLHAPTATAPHGDGETAEIPTPSHNVQADGL